MKNSKNHFKLASIRFKNENSGYLTPRKITISDNETFILNGFYDDSASFLYVSFYGSKDDVKKYEFSLTVKTESKTYYFRGPIISIDETNASHLKVDGNMFALPKHSCGFNKDEIIDVKIHDLKEEANDENVESGVSDVSD